MDRKTNIRKIIDRMKEADVRNLLCELTASAYSMNEWAQVSRLLSDNGLSLEAIRMLEGIDVARFNSLYKEAAREEGWMLDEVSTGTVIGIFAVNEDGDPIQAEKTCLASLAIVAGKAAAGSKMHLLALFLCGHNNNTDEEDTIHWPSSLRDEEAVAKYFPELVPPVAKPAVADYFPATAAVPPATVPMRDYDSGDDM